MPILQRRHGLYRLHKKTEVKYIMRYRNRKIKRTGILTAFVLFLAIASHFCMDFLQAEVIVDDSYSIAVSGGEDIDLDGVNNVLIYLKYTDYGRINASNINLTFQLSGSTSNLLDPSEYTWNVEYEDAVARSMFTERPLGGPSYTHSFDISPNMDADGNYVPSVKRATVRVYYGSTVLANKTIYIITPITMDGFETDYPTISGSYFMLRRSDDTEHTQIENSRTLQISTTENISWYYRPRTSTSKDDWKEITSGVTFVDISYPTSGTVKFTANEQSGAVSIVGRIKENGYYTETVIFDILIAAYCPDENIVKDMTYAQKIYYNSVVRHTGDLNVWYDRSIPEYVDVVKLDGTSKQITANYYGSVLMDFCPVGQDLSDKYCILYDKLKCQVTANVIFDIIKSVGNTGWTRIIPGSTEVLSVGSAMTIMTNIRGTKNEMLTWSVSNDNELTYTNLENYNDEIKSTAISATTYSAGYRLAAQTGANLVINCSSYNIGEERKFEIIITDGLSIEPSSVAISVGDFVNIEVTATDVVNPIYWDIVNSSGESISDIVQFVTDPSGKTIARITGLKAGVAYVTAAQSTGNSTITVKCKVTVSDSLEDVKMYGDISEGKVTIAQGDQIDLNVELWDSKGNPFEVKRDDIKWVSLSPTIVKAEMDQYDPTLVHITGLNVGKAYVAVVANDISQSQIDIVEVIVVAAPSGIVISEHSVEDSIDNISYRLNATIQPEGAKELEIEWSSSDPSIATVNSSGLVFYHKAGEVVITARVGTYTDTCIFRIITPVRSIILSETEKDMMIGETLLLVATLMPADATNKEVIWESSDTRVATVEESGLVTAVGSGTAHITCRAQNGDVTASCTINVYQQVMQIQLNYHKLTVRKGSVLWLYASVIPDTAVNKEIVWSSSDPKVASIDEYGQITALASGKTTITVTSTDTGAQDTCELTVSEAVTGITLNVRHMSIEIGEKYILIPTVRPAEAENKSVTWMSSNPAVAVVDQNGVVTGIKGGTTVIICQTVDRGLIASCTITVNEYIDDIKFSMDEVFIPKGETKTLNVKVTPESATVKKFDWKSQNEAIVTVDSSGMAYGVDYGTVIVTATTTDGSERKATCKVTVIKPVDSLTLNETMIQVREGKTYQLVATLLPADATVRKVIWTSSDTSVARVNSFGIVTGVKEGTCVITATAADGCGAFEKCEVTVLKSITVTGITVNSQDTTMVVGETRTVAARMKPTDTTEEYSWVSSDDAIVKVDKNGKVTAVGPGTATITAVTDISGAEAGFKVTVVSLNTTSLSLEQYDTYNLYVDGINSGITWYSRNKRVATVDTRGRVVARQAGTTTIVARINGKRVVCEITVKDLKK